MATPCSIRMELPTGESKSVYCHWDGYPGHTGRILSECYNTTEKVRELLELGSLSVLGKKVKPDAGDNHSFENPTEGVTIAFHRDRGDDLHTADVGTGYAYNYKWDGKIWSRSYSCTIWKTLKY